MHATATRPTPAGQALELWPEGADEGRRAEALERYAAARQLAGELAEAARAWRGALAARPATSAESPTRSAGSGPCSMRGDREAAFAARRAAAEAFAAGRPTAEAAVERLAIANQRRLAARHGEAIELARAARADADRAGRSTCACARWASRAWRGPSTATTRAGLETVRSGLALALEHDLTAVAAELYQRLSVTLYDSADYRRAEEALDAAASSAAPAPTPRRRSPA